MNDDDKTPGPDFPADDTVEVLDVSALIDEHLDAQTQNDFENEIPTVVEVRHICPGCGGDQFRMEDYDQVPASHGQAWCPGPLHNGEHLWSEGACRGNRFWHWCRAHEEHGKVGTLTIKSQDGKGGMQVHFFRDRRLAKRPVAVERRGLPPGAPGRSK